MMLTIMDELVASFRGTRISQLLETPVPPWVLEIAALFNKLPNAVCFNRNGDVYWVTVPDVRRCFDSALKEKDMARFYELMHRFEVGTRRPLQNPAYHMIAIKHDPVRTDIEDIQTDIINGTCPAFVVNIMGEMFQWDSEEDVIMPVFASKLGHEKIIYFEMYRSMTLYQAYFTAVYQYCESVAYSRLELKEEKDSRFCSEVRGYFMEREYYKDY